MFIIDVGAFCWTRRRLVREDDSPHDDSPRDLQHCPAICVLGESAQMKESSSAYHRVEIAA